ncbi:hypothetical protein PB1_14454 [Bacillus methanolicus PB1]|uniref:Uncharacterized protein n=1 Tax=Bacillus methanolicus PB1 TaxID=997296 RepID=I3DWZ6_BACMT|nr:hypothetical protein PB1_14454 [Bacillus methanolicus PB1]
MQEADRLPTLMKTAPAIFLEKKLEADTKLAAAYTCFSQEQ